MKNLNLATIEYNGNTIEACENYMLFNNRPVKIRKNKEYTYRLNKTCISAQGGTYGLYAFIVDCIKDNFGLVWVDAIINHMKKLTGTI